MGEKPKSKKTPRNRRTEEPLTEVPPIVNPPVDTPVVHLDQGYAESIREMYGLPPLDGEPEA